MFMNRGRALVNNSSGFMGGLYMIAEWGMKFSLTNLLWILFNFPIVLTLMIFLMMQQIQGGLLLIILLFFMLPLLFFPATTAMFAIVRDWIINDEDGHQLFKSYWRYYIENYKRSVANGFVLTSVWLIMLGDIYYFIDKYMIVAVLFMVLALILFVFTVNLFSVTVHYHMTFFKAMKSAFFTTIGSPVLFLAVAISCGTIVYMSLHVVRYLIPFLTFSFLAFLSFSAFYRNYLKINEKVS